MFNTENMIKITAKEALNMIKQSKVVESYEYYDGFHLTFDGIKYLFEITEDSCSNYEDIIRKFKSKMFEIPEGIVEFSYTTRFPEGLTYKKLIIPSTLKSLEIMGLNGIQKGQLEGITSLSLNYMSDKKSEIDLLPKSLQRLNITEVLYSNNTLSEFKSKLTIPHIEVNEIWDND